MIQTIILTVSICLNVFQFLFAMLLFIGYGYSKKQWEERLKEVDRGPISDDDTSES